MASRIFSIDESTRVSEVRRCAIALAQDVGLDQNAVSNLAIIATELSTNLLKHALQGEIHISPSNNSEQKGIEILSIDRGPGMGNLRACVTDGYSTTGTAGTGLGAVIRLSSTFDAYSEMGRGTVLVSRLQMPRENADAGSSVVAGVVSRPVTNELVSGDMWAVRRTKAGALLLLADGLGHGRLAAEASGEAVAAFERSPDVSPVPILQQIHTALRGTRGAAVAVAHLEFTEDKCTFGGIGNIAARVITSESTKHMVSHAGTAGYEARRFQEFTYPLPASAIVVVHSDGLTSGWNLDRHIGLLSHDPSLIAAVLYRDEARGRDDICVIVAKWQNSQ